MNPLSFESKKFAIIGVAGYIAPRHLKAMVSLKQDLVAAHDIFDSVGIMNGYYPHAYFTTDVNKFKTFISTNHINYLTVCTPNFLHCEHAIIGLQSGSDVICEKPLTLSPDSLRQMEKYQKQTGHCIYTILQLRYHPEIIRLKQFVESNDPQTIYDIDLAYITPRGMWYSASWKGNILKSGGLTANIGIHFIDMLHWIFGETENVTVHYSSADCSAGFLRLKKARIRYFLSINPKHRPHTTDNTMSPYRNMLINGEKFDFTNGFTDLHTLSYSKILQGKGFTIKDASPAIDTLWTINHTAVSGFKGDYHPIISEIIHQL